MREIGHFIGGKAVKGTSGRFGDVFDPNTGEVQAKVALAKHSEVEHAIANAQAAQPGWAATNPQRRARVMFKFLELIQKEFDALAKLLSSEHGKTVPDARGDIQRGVEVAEFACGIPHLLKGEFTEGAGPAIDLYSVRQPLGVVAGHTQRGQRRQGSGRHAPDRPAGDGHRFRGVVNHCGIYLRNRLRQWQTRTVLRRGQESYDRNA